MEGAYNDGTFEAVEFVQFTVLKRNEVKETPETDALVAVVVLQRGLHEHDEVTCTVLIFVLYRAACQLQRGVVHAPKEVDIVVTALLFRLQTQLVL